MPASACQDVLRRECFPHGEQEEQAAGAARCSGYTCPIDPIGDLGFLSDGEVSALVSPNGAVEWMCVPRFDSPSVFGRMLGRQAGVFRVAPVDVAVPADVRYLPGTMILETSWGTPTGWIIVRDALLIGPWHHPDGPIEDLPSDPERLRGRAHLPAHHPLCLG